MGKKLKIVEISGKGGYTRKVFFSEGWRVKWKELWTDNAVTFFMAKIGKALLA